MRIAKQGAVILFAGAFALACAEDTEGGGNNNNNSNSGGSTSNTGGSTNNTGGTTNNTGGSTNNTGGSTNNTGGTTNGSGGSNSLPGTPVGGLAWTPADGTIEGCTLEPWGDCAGPVATSVTFTGTGAEPVASLALVPYDDGACFDASSYTGIRFTVTGEGLQLFSVAVEATTPDTAECGTASCPAPPDEPDANCWAHPRKEVSGTGPIEVPFSQIMAPDWAGVTATMTTDKIRQLNWYVANGSTVTISNIEYY